MQIPTGFIDIYDWVGPTGLVFARVSGLFLIAPLLGGVMIPIRVRALLALSLTLVLAPSALQDYEPGLPTFMYLVALIRELLLGLFLGMVVEFFLQAVRFGGDVIGRLAGFAAAETFNPLAESMTGPTGDLLYIPMILLFLGTNGHHDLIASLAHTFAIVPIGAFAVDDAVATAAVQASDQVFQIGIAVAFPVIAGIMAITVAEGVVARAVPQINILHITFASKIMGSMLILYLGVPAAVAFMGTILTMIQQFLVRLMPAL